MEFELLGWPGEGVTLELDYREFSYAGKFVMGETGKAVLTERGSVLAAASFSPDRTDDSCFRIRYITVRGDRRGDGLGPKLLSTLRLYLLDRDYEHVVIAVNNPFAYQAAYRAGFVWTGDETGLAELELTAPGDRDQEQYRAGLTRYRDRATLSDRERSFIDEHDADQPPDPIDPPDDWRP